MQSPSPKIKSDIKKMFDDISHSYDFLNHLFSFNIDKYWRRTAVKLLDNNPELILDTASGTGDFTLSISAVFHGKIIASDFSTEMLNIAKRKIKKTGLDNIYLCTADAEHLPFKNNSFDAAVCAFGIRNFQDLKAGLGEIYRVLRAECPAVILEFSNPDSRFIRFIYDFYFKIIMPFIGRIVSRHKDAYSYLPESVERFPERDEVADILKKSGFKNIYYRKLTFGIVTVYKGIK